MRLCLVVLAALTFVSQSLVAQQPPGSPSRDRGNQPRVIVSWRHFGPQPGDVQQPSDSPRPAEIRPVAYVAPADEPPQPPATSTNDAPADSSATPVPEISASSTVASLSADFEKREQDRNIRRQELEATATKDPTLQALTEIQTTRLLLEGEQDRMQSSDQLSQTFTDLATKLQSHVYQVKVLLKTRRQTAEQADAEIARINAQTSDLNVALKNMAMLPGSSENDEFLKHLDGLLTHLDQILKVDQEKSQQAHLQIKSLETDEQELDTASQQARTKGVAFDQASKDAKVNEDLLANRLEFSLERKRALDELSETKQVLETSVTARGDAAVQQAVLGGIQPQAPEKMSQQIDSLRDCIRRTGEVTACRAGERGQP